MKTTLKLVMATLALSYGTAHADFLLYGFNGDTIEPGQITVSGDQNGYKTVQASSDIRFQASLSYDTGVAGRIKSWRIDPLIAINGKQMNPFFLTTYGVGQTFGKGNRPKEIDLVPFVTVPISYVKNRILDECNAAMQKRIDDGMPVAQAFSTVIEMPLEADFNVTVEATGAGSKNPNVIPESPIDLQQPTIVCKTIPMPPVDIGGFASNTPGQSNNSSPQLKAPSTATLTPIQRPTAKPVQVQTIPGAAARPDPAGSTRARQ